MQSWEEIYRSQAPRLLGLCRRYVQDLSLAEDLMHDAFFTAINKQDSYTGSGPVEGWLRKITVNTVLMYLRREKRLLEISRHETPVPPDDPWEDDSDDPLQLMLNAGLDNADLLEALDLLPDHHRVVFNLYVMEGYTHPQIAAELGISTGTSKSHLARARKKIQAILISKVKSMQQKKRRAILLFFPFFKRGEHAVDQLFRDALQNNSLEPGKSLPPALVDAMRKSVPPPLAKPLFVAWKGLLGIGIICLAGAGAWWMQPATNEAPPAPIPAPSWSAPRDTQSATQLSLGEKEYVPSSGDSAPEKWPPATPRRAPATSAQQYQAAENAIAAETGQHASETPPPVVIRKKIVQKDTLYQFDQPGKRHEN